MDIYLTKKRVYLVDFNPFHEATDSLLFSWDELKQSTHQPQPDSNEPSESDDASIVIDVSKYGFPTLTVGNTELRLTPKVHIVVLFDVNCISNNLKS